MKGFRRVIFGAVDVAMLPMVLPSALILWFVRHAGVKNLSLCRRLLLTVGIFPLRKHYYDPQFDFAGLSRPLQASRSLPGIRWNVTGQLELLREFRYSDELQHWTAGKTKHGFSLDNSSFKSGDAEYWYSMIRHFKPSRIIEIGSGNSTRVAMEALEANTRETPGYTCDHICIEPYEVQDLEQWGVTVYRKKLEEVDVHLFKDLRENDMLFIDSSHMIRPQGDVLEEYLHILPLLNRGVIVHIHDIFSPRDYPEDWLVNQVLFWNEQYLVEAFLTHNESWEILAALNYLHHNHTESLARACPHLSPAREPGSLYIRRV
jgi:hypothetical protein